MGLPPVEGAVKVRVAAVPEVVLAVPTTLLGVPGTDIEGGGAQPGPGSRPRA